MLPRILTYSLVFPVLHRIPSYSLVYPASPYIPSYSLVLLLCSLFNPQYSLAFPCISPHSLVFPRVPLCSLVFPRVPSHSLVFHRIPPYSLVCPYISSYSPEALHSLYAPVFPRSPFVFPLPGPSLILSGTPSDYIFKSGWVGISPLSRPHTRPVEKM